ncbi:MAG: helix-turn-helix domain-containing protein [Candidatus Pacebacteria bacterium]|nr:helix-turn-helix domain-containing protein [Candidatus Paceibacterota bacterium]
MIAEENILIEAGLSEEQALIYNALLEKGPQKASVLATWTGIKRSLVYKVLEQLEGMLLVSKKGGSGSVAVFFPEHPSQILRFIEQKEKAITLSKETVAVSLGSFVSKYNLLSDKPNIQFYEGLSGIRKVLWDTLTVPKETVIYTYVDLDAVMKYIPKINEEYTQERKKIGIQKKGMMLDTPQARATIKEYHTEITETKFAKFDALEFETIMQIYENKISYITLKENSMIGVIIEDASIYKMHKAVFEYLWSITPKEQSIL